MYGETLHYVDLTALLQVKFYKEAYFTDEFGCSYPIRFS